MSKVVKDDGKVEIRLDPRELIKIHLEGDIDLTVGRDPEWVLVGKPNSRMYGGLSWVEDTDSGPVQRVVVVSKIVGYDMVVQEVGR